jgi:hypothetical protein
MQSILVATPCLYGKVDAYYVHSLCESIKLGLTNELNIRAIFLADESILPMARNELINLAYREKYDAMVFIDDDEYWSPETLIEILLSDKDVVGVPVVNKSDKEIKFNVYPDQNSKNIDSQDGYFPVPKVGTGFLKLSKKAIVDLCESNPEIIFRNKKLRNVFEYGQTEGQFVGEDIMLCTKLTELGYTIWINPSHTVSHLGPKMYRANFLDSIKSWYDKK